MTTTIRRVSMSALLAFSLIACGGGSDDSGDSADTGSEQEAGSSDGGDSSGDDNGNDVSGGAAEGDEPDDDMTIATIGDLPGVSDECEAIANFLGATGQIFAGLLPVDEARAIVDDFLASVDDSIRPAAAVLGDYTVSLLQLVNDLGSFEAVLTTPEGQAAINTINTPEYDEANQAISAYFGEKCGLGG